jgi:NAD(P)-dependent dehydrogenase (short-subunit alcohol dehydrogenase family)
MSADAGSVRVAVITGATSGIGKETARGLAARGFRVIVAGRGAERARAVAAEIAAATGNAAVEGIDSGDLSSIRDMRTLAATLLERYPRIHVLVNNAGAFFARRETTVDGLERTFALNVLAPFVLTAQLADRLIASAPARVVNISSAAHRRSSLDLDDLQSTRRYRGFLVYGGSKLALILLTREFSRRLAADGVTVNAVHPGFVASGFAQNNGGTVAATTRFFAVLFGRSVRRGALTPIFVASDPSLEETTGMYFSGRRAVRTSRRAEDAELGARLFAACATMAGARA